MSILIISLANVNCQQPSELKASTSHRLILPNLVFAYDDSAVFLRWTQYLNTRVEIPTLY